MIKTTFKEKRFLSQIDKNSEYIKYYELYCEAGDKGDKWEVSYEENIPYEKEFVWDVLLHTEYLDDWLRGNHCDGRVSKALPDKFYIGTSLGEASLPNLGHHDKAFIIFCEPKKSFTFSLNYYYKIEIDSFERYSTRIKISIFGYKILNFIQKLFSPSTDKAPYILSHDYNKLEKGILRFKRLCHDFMKYGGPIESLGYWSIDWRFYVPGVIHFYQNPAKENTESPYIGEFVKADEKLGYVYPQGSSSNDHEYYKERCYISSPRDGYIIDILKQNGENTGNDRILILSENPKYTKNG